MPKTPEETKTLAEFESEYGDKKGKEVYYGLRNKNKKFDRSQGGGFSSKKARAEWWASRLEKAPLSVKSEIGCVLEADRGLHWWLLRVSGLRKANSLRIENLSKQDKY